MTFKLNNTKIKKLILFARDGREIPVFLRSAYADDKGTGYWRKAIEEKLKKVGLKRADLLLKFIVITAEGEKIPVDLTKQEIIPERIAKEIIKRIFGG